MSFKEKSAWISLLSMSIIYGNYFWSIEGQGLNTGGLHFGNLLVTTILLVTLQVMLHIAVAVISPKDAKAQLDEREKIIELQSTRIAYGGLVSVMVLACIFGALDPSIKFNTNELLFILVATELLRSASQIINYRRSA